MSRARDANLRHSDWFKSASCSHPPAKTTTGEQLAHTQHSDFDKAISSPSVNTPAHDYILSNQIVYTVLGIDEYSFLEKRYLCSEQKYKK